MRLWEVPPRDLGPTPPEGEKFREKHSYFVNTPCKSTNSPNPSGFCTCLKAVREAFIRATILGREEFSIRPLIATVLFSRLTLPVPMLAMPCILRGPDGPANQP